MDFRHLQTFRMIVEEGSFAGAAEQLQYAQSTVTLQVQQLETELGIALFDRSKKKVQLTDAGRNLLPHATYVLNQMEALHHSMQELLAGETGHIRLGVIEPLASLRLPRILLTFCEAYPKVNLTLEVLGTGITSQKVADGELDLGITAAPRPGLNLIFEPLFVDAMVLLLSEDHPLNQLEDIAITDLAHHRLLLTHPSCAYREFIERTMNEQGVKLYSGIEIGSMEALKRAVQHRLGVAIIPGMATNTLPEGTVTRQFANLELLMSIGMVRRPDLIESLALQDLSTWLRKEFSQTQEQRPYRPKLSGKYRMGEIE